MKHLGAVLCLLLIWAGPVAAQQLDVGLKGQADGKVVLVLGDLRGHAIPDHALAALGFLVRWSKGHFSDVAVETPLRTAQFSTSLTLYRLQLPAQGLILAPVGVERTAVQLVTCRVQGPTPLTCPLTIELTRSTEQAAWRVSGVTVP